MRRADVLTKLVPPAPPVCPAVLGRWVLRTAKSTATFPDGGIRPQRLRGGRLVTTLARCTGAAGHAGPHHTAEGATWS